jgi:hypothetical protein
MMLEPQGDTDALDSGAEDDDALAGHGTGEHGQDDGAYAEPSSRPRKSRTLSMSSCFG